MRLYISCFGAADGEIDITIAGGTPNYSYVWTASNGGVIPAGQANVQDLTLLIAGTYQVVVTDASGVCSITRIVDSFTA